MRIFFALLVHVAILSGCTIHHLPELASTRLPDKAKIGVLVDIGSRPHHIHRGYTRLGKFKKVYPYTWDLKKRTKAHFMDIIASHGYQPVDLEQIQLYYSFFLEFLVQENGEWVIQPGKEKLAAKLLEDHDIRAIVLVKETQTAVEYIRGAPGSRRQYWSVLGSGIYSNPSSKDVYEYKAVAGVNLKVLSLDPLADLSYYYPLSYNYIWSVKARDIDIAKVPKDKKNITEEEFKGILPLIEESMKDLAHLSICAINQDNACSEKFFDPIKLQVPHR